LYKVKKHQGKTTTRQETLDGKTWEVAAGEGNYIHTPFGRLHPLFAMCAGLWGWFRTGKLQQLQKQIVKLKDDAAEKYMPHSHPHCGSSSSSNCGGKILDTYLIVLCSLSFLLGNPFSLLPCLLMILELLHSSSLQQWLAWRQSRLLAITKTKSIFQTLRQEDCMPSQAKALAAVCVG